MSKFRSHGFKRRGFKKGHTSFGKKRVGKRFRGYGPARGGVRL